MHIANGLEKVSRVILLGAAFGISVSAAAAPPPGATILYDAQGFENPPFTLTDLSGQDGWFEAIGAPPATPIDSFAVVTASAPSSLGQSVEVFRAADEAGNWFVPNLNAPLPGQDVVVIEWSQYVVSHTDVAYGPLFGVEAFNSTITNLTRLAGVFIDAADGAVFALDADNSGFIGTNNPLNPASTPDARDAWHDFAMYLDFGAAGNQPDGSEGQVTIYMNGELIYTDDFAESLLLIAGLDSTAFTDAPIAAFADPSFPDQEGTAYFDNYIVYVIPEPGSLALLGLGALALVARRRRSASIR